MIEPQTVKIVLRGYDYGDQNFILSTWLKGNYYGNPYFGMMPKDLYFDEYAIHILSLLADGAQISIACDQDNPSWIIGFSVNQGPDLHWIYVKRDFRGRGIANLLLHGKNISTMKSMTFVSREFAQKKGFVFNPL